jgi:hypothetical protein
MLGQPKDPGKALARRLFRVIAATCALLPHSAGADEPTDRIDAAAHPTEIDLSWSDTEDRLRGTLVPGRPRAGEPLHVVIDVGSYDGKPFEGPLTLRLRRMGEQTGESPALLRGRGWQADFHPAEPGPYLLDVTFRTTRLKVLHATFDVRESRLPGVLWWTLFGLAVTAGSGYAAFRIIRGRKAPPAASLP